ncbi:hypothetical protein VZT92_023251 [Zoarces viviparus]|uniref:Uncharacterized protein n=1 Tax=Zoarces viviparus TaxID=48416 RepID=A0AAW1E625_ZOAVI
MEIQQKSPSCAASYLRVSVVVVLSVAVLDEDPRSTQPCPPIWACICGADQRSRLVYSLEKRRDQGSESPPGRQPRLAHLLVSPALLGHSSQPLSNRRARERAFEGGGGVGGA